MGSLFGEVYYINPTMSTILHHGIGRLGLLYTESATGLLLLDNSYEMVHSYIYQTVRGYTAPRTNLIPELQQRYQPIENLMLWQRLVTIGKQKLGLLRRQRSS